MSLNTRVVTHPSFAVLRLFRSSGCRRLFESSVLHQGYVSLEICAADLHVDESTSAHHTMPGETLIRVAMSESQFARAITSFSLGCGVPCTIDRHNDISVPEPPATDEAETVKSAQDANIKTALRNMLQCANDLSSYVENGKRPTVKEVRELIGDIQRIVGQLEGNQRFFQDRFTEVIEREKDIARAEIEAHVNLVLRNAGLEGKASTALPHQPNRES